MAGTTTDYRSDGVRGRAHETRADFDGRGAAAQLGLHVVAGPAFFDQVAPDKETRVIVCLVILAESHLALHAFPAERFVHVDLFSCKPFAIGAARAFIESQFRPSSLVLHTLDRAR